MQRKRRKNIRRRKRNPSLADINSTAKILIGVAVIGGIWYFGSAISDMIKKLFGAIAAPFSAVAQVPLAIAQWESPSQTANTAATGDDTTDSIAVGAAGGG
jgi:hypothetical protein